MNMQGEIKAGAKQLDVTRIYKRYTNFSLGDGCHYKRSLHQNVST